MQAMQPLSAGGGERASMRGCKRQGGPPAQHSPRRCPHCARQLALVLWLAKRSVLPRCRASITHCLLQGARGGAAGGRSALINKIVESAINQTTPH